VVSPGLPDGEAMIAPDVGFSGEVLGPVSTGISIAAPVPTLDPELVASSEVAVWACKKAGKMARAAKRRRVFMRRDRFPHDPRVSLVRRVRPRRIGL
jgi:hypothetical protein